MWTLLIVEDELFIRESIRKNINWENEGYIVIGEAGNGEEALEFIQQYKPDLILSDIVMPIMDGVTLLRKTRESGLDCRFIMLSNMSEFEYVRQALEFGASSYLLKLSMNPESIKESLHKVRKELSQKEQQLSRAVDTYLQQFWRNTQVVIQEITVPESLAARYDYFYCFSVLHGKATFALADFLELQLCEIGPFFRPYIHTSMGLSILLIGSSTPSDLSITKTTSVRYKTVYSKKTKANELHEQVAELLLTTNAIWFQEEIKIVPTGALSISPQMVDIPWEEEREIIRRFEQKKSDACKQAIEHLWKEMRTEEMPLHLTCQIALRLDQLFHRISGYPYQRDSLIPAMIGHQALLDAIVARMGQCLNNWFETQELTDHAEINKVIQYIKQYYDRNISVQAMGKLVSMEQSYLGTLFKKKTGQSLIHYLHKVRIEQSLFYLEETQMSINEICERVGYENENYYIKMFKRFMNTTPTFYRKSKNESQRS